MLENLQKFFYKYKNYILFLVLINISLIFLSVSKNSADGFKARTFPIVAFFSRLFSYSDDYLKLQSENDNLRERNAILMLENTRLMECAQNSEKLKRLISLKDTSSFTLIAGTVISKSFKTNEVNFIINLGLKDSVKVGMPVIDDRGLVGIIKLVSGNYSVVNTLLNTDVKLAVKNQRSHADGILEFNGNDLIVKNSPNIYDMQNGDVIITSDFSTIFPPKIPVGYIVRENRKDEKQISNFIPIKPLVDFGKVDKIFVVKYVQDLVIDNVSLNLYKSDN